MMDNLIETLKKEYSSKSPKPLNSQFRWGCFAWMGLFLCLLLVCFSGCRWNGFDSPYIRPTKGEMVYPRTDALAIRLKDGRVLICGGALAKPLAHLIGSHKDGYPFQSSDRSPAFTAEIYNPKTETFTPTGKMHFWHDEGVATLLQDGRVLISGGRQCLYEKCNLPVSTNEIYDPKTGQFSITGAMITPRYDHHAVLMLNGKVLIAGGKEYKSCDASKLNKFQDCPPYREDETLKQSEIYDPNNGLFQPFNVFPYGQLNGWLISYNDEILRFNIIDSSKCGVDAFNVVTGKSNFLTFSGCSKNHILIPYIPLPGNQKIFAWQRDKDILNPHPDHDLVYVIIDLKKRTVTKKFEISADLDSVAEYIAQNDNIYALGYQNPVIFGPPPGPNKLYHFNLNTNQFEELGNLPDSPIIGFTTVSLPDNKILIVGGSYQNKRLEESEAYARRHFAWLYDPN